MEGPLALVYPVMAQVLFTLVMMLWTGLARGAALRARRVRLSQVALSGDVASRFSPSGWPSCS